MRNHSGRVLSPRLSSWIHLYLKLQPACPQGFEIAPYFSGYFASFLTLVTKDAEGQTWANTPGIQSRTVGCREREQSTRYQNREGCSLGSWTQSCTHFTLSSCCWCRCRSAVSFPPLSPNREGVVHLPQGILYLADYPYSHS